MRGVGAALPPAIRPLPLTGAQYRGVGSVAVVLLLLLHHPTAAKSLRNTGGGAAGARGAPAHSCTRIVLS